MKLTKIEAWNNHDGLHTYLRRHYTDPGIEQIVWLNPDKVTTFLRKDNIHQIIKTGIHHRVRPST